jgi:hypothetical protein
LFYLLFLLYNNGVAQKEVSLQHDNAWRTLYMIVRVVVFLFVIWGLAMGAVWLVASQLRRLIGRATPGSNKQPKIAAELVCCKSCGTYVPEEEAIMSHNCYYCSDVCKK